MDELTDLTHEATPPNRRRHVLVGAVLGATALAGTIVGVGAVAGAQNSSDPEPATADAASLIQADVDAEFDAEWDDFDQCMADQLGGLWEDAEPDQATIEAWDTADAACAQFLPEEIQAEIAAWAPYEECIEAQIGDLADPNFDDDAAWEAYDEAWEAADTSCRDLLPADALAEFDAFDAFDRCLDDSGAFDDEGSFGPFVSIETGDGFQAIEFGETAGTVTITGDVNGVSISTDGGVTVLDEAALGADSEAIDAVFEQCEQLLPEDLREPAFFAGTDDDSDFES